MKTKNALIQAYKALTAGKVNLAVKGAINPSLRSDANKASFNCILCDMCELCYNCTFCYNCYDCENCLLCSNLINKGSGYYVLNKRVGKLYFEATLAILQE